MSKARTLADFISDGSEFADGTISVAEVSGAAPLASPTFTGNVDLGDNVQIRLGDDNDLRIYHDVSTGNSYIWEQGTGGELWVLGTDIRFANTDFTSNYARFVDGGEVELFHGNQVKLETAADGVDITGDVGATTATITGKTTTDELDLNALAATISDTAVDIFVYDTRKDSDGGAWRKRTQGTSWYNETLNTATRGSRKEFPSVAVIVAESNQVTIYDGDDPSLPMWMVFNTGGNWNHILVSTSGYVRCVAMLNGHLVIGRNLNTGWQLTKTSFVDDSSYGYKNAAHGTSDGVWTGGIAARNGDGSYYDNGVASNILSPYNNDVAMTVLPNAPIDAATGLPVPTIAVATDGGVSVIKDDGTVVDYSANSSFEVISVGFTSRGDVFGSQWFASTVDEKGYIFPLLSSDGSMDGDRIELFAYTTSSGDNMFWGGKSSSGNSRVSYGNTNVFGDEVVAGQRFTVTQLVRKKQYENLLNYTSSSYNTGWMNGDIKLATLSDTDDTDVTGSELVTNGTFDTDSDWEKSSHWTISGGSASMPSTGLYYPLWQYNLGMVAGKKYTATVEVTALSGSIKFDTCSNTGGSISNADGIVISSTGTHSFTFIAESDQDGIGVARESVASCTVDNISVRLAEEDRSVNGNGLQVFGTVTKNPVATGADLVAYSGFSSGGNYLLQPYNSDLDFGTGDFSVTWWMKSGSFSYYDVMARQGSTLVDGGWLVQATPSHMTWYVYASGWKSTYRAVVDADNGVWQQYSFVRRNGKVSFYVNGLYVADTLGTSQGNQDDDMTPSTPIPLSIGRRMDENVWALSNGSLALVRISATAPSPEQIAKIYEDEKVLFQENAQATLYGSSDAVTALAYDDSTELLHVGTSAGRSVFQGLRRVDNTTTAVGAAISASNGLVADE